MKTSSIWQVARILLALLAIGILVLGFFGGQEAWWRPLSDRVLARNVELPTSFDLPDPPPLGALEPGDEELPTRSEKPSSSSHTNPSSSTAGQPGEAWITYETQSGDTLPALAVRFGVRVEDIQGPPNLPETGFLPPGTRLRIPARPFPTSSDERFFPDSEVVNSPSAVGFDVEDFVKKAGGYLASYEQYLPSPGQIPGYDVVRFVALNYSINPRLLLALLEYQAQWVFGNPPTEEARLYPLGTQDTPRGDLYRQLRWAAEQLAEGYYGWREGRLTQLVFPNGEILLLAPTLNAGTVALMYYFSQHYPREQWERILDPEHPEGFLAFYESLFGDPWYRAKRVEPLYPPDLRQPRMILPFSRGSVWFLTSGPHGAYGQQGAWAALDFAPLGGVGCYPSRAWVLAAAPGQVVRSERGVVVLDLDGDGYEQTGWVLFYLHIATQDRVPAGTFLERGGLIGHPSCEGGQATGTNLHIVRRYNGEWIAAAGPVPFNLGGWIAHGGEAPREGYLQRGDEVVEASIYGGEKARIIRTETDP